METITRTKWAIDTSHSEIGFKVKHMMLTTVSGYFEDFAATVESEGENFKDANIEVAIDIGSIKTKSADRDAHLRSADFFDADNFPKMHFKSKSFDGETLVGDLTIKGVTKEISLDATFHGVATDPYGQTKAGFEVSGEINRKDFGLTWSAVTEAGSVVVADKVKLLIDAQFVKQE